MRRTRVTAVDVARAAAVSPATVSLVVNGKDDRRVHPETKRRVLEKAAALGYAVDRRAQGLATGKSGLIGFLVPGMRNPFFSAVYTALLREFGSGYQVLTVATDMGKETRDSVSQLVALGVDGIVAIAVDNIFIEPLQSRAPMVLVDTDRPGPGVVALNLTDEKAARDLAMHLLELGHRKLVYVDAVRVHSRSFTVRRDAILDTMARRGAEAAIEVATHVDIDHTAAIVGSDVRSWIAAGATAIVCATDLQAYGALVGLKDRGVSVPEELSLAGFDDLALSRVVTPPLTTVRVPAAEIARIAATEIRRMLDGDTSVRDSIIVPLELRRRESTGPAPMRPGSIVPAERTALDGPYTPVVGAMREPSTKRL